MVDDDDGTHLAETIVTRKTLWNEGIVVNEMTVPADVPETIPCDPVGNGGVAEGRISTPVVLNAGKFVDPHADIKSRVGS